MHLFGGFANGRVHEPPLARGREKWRSWVVERMGHMGLMGRRDAPNAKRQTPNAKRQTPNSIHDMEPGAAKRLDSLRQLPVAHQDVIGIEGADGEDTDTGMSQRHSNRNEYTDQIEV